MIQDRVASAQKILSQAFKDYDCKLGLSCSFGKDSVTVLHLAQQIDPDVLAIYINTGLDFPETQTFKDDLVRDWNINLREIKPTQENVEYRNALDPDLNLSDPNLCCDLLKVEPTERAIQGLDTWIVGLRRDETVFRRTIEPFEELEKPNGGGRLVRVAPVFDWTESDIWKYIETYDIPYHPLYDEGYRSMGCMPCSKAGRWGRFERAGRWAGADKEECGIHTFLSGASESQRDLPSSP